MALAATPAPSHSARNITEVQMVPLAKIEASTLNPRSTFHEEAITELAASIEEHGLLQPLTLRPHREGYIVVAGERRLRAVRSLYWRTVPAIIREDLDDVGHLKIALVENLQRQDLDPIEEAEGYAQLNRVVGLKQSEIAAAVHRSQPAIANTMRLLELPEPVIELVRQRTLTPAHGKALLKYVKWPKLCEAIALMAATEGYTTKLLEKGIGHGGIQPYELKNAGLLADVPYDADEKALRAAGVTIWGEKAWAYSPDGALLKKEMSRIVSERNAERSRALQKLRDEGNGKPLVLDKLGYGNYARLDGYPATEAGVKAGDPGTCQAVDQDGSLVWITTDMKGMNERRKAAEKEKQDGIRAALSEYLWQAEQNLTPLSTGVRESSSSKAMALLAFYVLADVDKPTRKAAWKQFATAERMTTKIDDLSWNSYQPDPRTLKWLEVWPPDVLVRVALDAAVRKNLSDFFTGYATNAQLTTWLTGVKMPDKGQGKWPPSVPVPASEQAD